MHKDASSAEQERQAIIISLLERVLALSAQWTKIGSFANSIDPDEMALNEPSHLDLHCLPFCIQFLTNIPVCDKECVKIQIWKSPFQKLRGERVLSYDFKKTTTIIFKKSAIISRAPGKLTIWMFIPFFFFFFFFFSHENMAWDLSQF